MPTLNAAFKQIFGEALEPLGFQKIKSKHPYFVRVVEGGEIIHIIACKNEMAGPGHKTFQILGGVATVYRPRLSLELSPRENSNWLEYISEFYKKSNHHNFDEDFRKSIFEFKCNEDGLADMLLYSLKLTKEIMLPVLDRIADIDSCIEYFLRYKSDMNINYDVEDFGKKSGNCFYNEGLLYVMTSKYGYYMEKKIKLIFEEAAEKMNRGESALFIDTDGSVRKYTQESYNDRYKMLAKEKKQRLARYAQFYNNHEWIDKAQEELKRRKVNNIEALKSYGLIIRK